MNTDFPANDEPPRASLSKVVGARVAATRAGAIAAGSPAAPAIRFVQETDGYVVPWTVIEVDARDVPGARGARCLIFAREGAIRRVWDYPSDWRTLDDAGLVELSQRR